MILSLDCSTTHTGWAVFEEDDLINYGRVIPNKDLEWRERIQESAYCLVELINNYDIQKIYVEDVPLINKQMKTLVQLGACQGMVLTLASAYRIPIEFISVGTWRKNIGLFDGTNKGKERDEMKIKSIKMANKLFNIDLPLVFTKNGNFNSNKSNDDTADAILIYASTRNKYKKKNRGFGRG